MSDAARAPRRRLRELVAHWLRRPDPRPGRLRVDGDLVELVPADGAPARTFDLAALAAVDVTHGTAAPGREPAGWTLVAADGTTLALPARLLPEALLDRLLALDGFDREALVAATVEKADGAVRCWVRG